MIRPLRKRHLRMLTTLAVLVVAVFAASLVYRAPVLSPPITNEAQP